MSLPPMSHNGPNAKCRHVRLSVAIGGETDMPRTSLKGPSLTQRVNSRAYQLLRGRSRLHGCFDGGRQMYSLAK